MSIFLSAQLVAMASAVAIAEPPIGIFTCQAVVSNGGEGEFSLTVSEDGTSRVLETDGRMSVYLKAQNYTKMSASFELNGDLKETYRASRKSATYYLEVIWVEGGAILTSSLRRGRSPDGPIKLLDAKCVAGGEAA